MNDRLKDKALNLLMDLIKNCRGIILDPFAGSCSTAIACERLNRQWVCIEIDEKDCEISAKRLEQETSQLKLFAG